MRYSSRSFDSRPEDGRVKVAVLADSVRSESEARSAAYALFWIGAVATLGLWVGLQAIL
jgi:hypothetical protein